MNTTGMNVDLKHHMAATVQGSGLDAHHPSVTSTFYNHSSGAENIEKKYSKYVQTK